jgi:hypothetical protein
MIIHYVEVDDVCAGSQHFIDFFAQFGEIGRKNGRSNLKVSHGEIPDTLKKHDITRRLLRRI